MTGDEDEPQQYRKRGETSPEERALEMDRRLRVLENRAIETKMRLENGVHTFNDLKNEISQRFGEVKYDIGMIKPKPPSFFQLFGTFFGAGVVMLGAWWTLSEKFNDRPTASQVAGQIRQHAEAGAHPEAMLEMKHLRDEIVQLKLHVDKLSTTLEYMRNKR